MTTAVVTAGRFPTAGEGVTQRWPASAGWRWLLRLALAEPLAIVVLIAHARGIVSDENQRLESAGQIIDWGSDDLAFVSQLYPPIPTAIASILPGGALTLGFVGALCAGVLLQVVWERLRRRRVPRLLTAALLLSVGATPAFLYAATQNLPAFLGLALFAVALAGFLRFAVEGDTQGGFQCGLALGLAALCDPATIVFAAVFGVAAPFVAWQRYRAEPGAVPATCAVVVFPAAAAFAGWAFVEWRFTGGAFATLRRDPALLDFPGGAGRTAVRELRWVVQRVVITPVYTVAAVLAVSRRRDLAVAPWLPLMAVFLVQFLGIHLANGQPLVILGTVAVMFLPAGLPRATQIAVGAVALLQVALAWVPWRPNHPVAVFVDQLFG
jgi:hypothetical protein